MALRLPLLLGAGLLASGFALAPQVQAQPPAAQQPPDEPPLPDGLEERDPPAPPDPAPRPAAPANDVPGAQETDPALPAEPGEVTEEVEEPALPSGLGGPEGEAEPSLPTGLEEPAPSEPSLPAGLATKPAPEPRDGEPTDAPPRARLPLQWQARLDLRGGAFNGRDPESRNFSIGEARAQLDLAQAFHRGSTTLRLVVDAVGDALAEQYVPQLETGLGAMDLRTASLTTTPAPWLDIRVGRQILTWGTGDLLFINDLFPKDWTAFLIGRDVEYLKAPSDAAKLALFTPWFDVDVIFTPRFDADRLPLRHRLSYFEPSLGRIAGEDAPLSLDRPERWLRDSEVAARLNATLGSWELAGYGYYGFWKSPAGLDGTTGRAAFPELAVYGASLRGPVLGGIVNLETGYYDSLEDRAGKDPLVRNSELRLLGGYELNPWRQLTTGVQYYAELTRFPGRNEQSLPSAAPVPDAVRHVVTLRLRLVALDERLECSLFLFTSPSDRDGYLRGRISYALNDHVRAELGTHLFAGREVHTFFGQFRYNSSVYGALRYAL